MGERFTFLESNVNEIKTEIECLNTHKATTCNNTPAKVLVNCKDISAGYITTAYNVSLAECNFPTSLKNADITPAHKKLETTLKIYYRPISILPSVSKIFESNIDDQIYTYMDKYLSPYLCGFRKGYSAQYCLMIMLERWDKAPDSKKITGAILTDPSKAFDCLHYGHLIAELEAYGFDHMSLGYIYSYITGRKQRTKVNNKFSGWSNILSGIPQGSILCPLLFNIYINDIFYFIDEGNIANYADDNTPYAIDTKTVINTLEKDVSTLMKWFSDNYMKLNEDKCHLQISNHDEDVSAIIGKELNKGKTSVKLLGITTDNKLNFEEHVSKLCQEVSNKLHALGRVGNYMSTGNLKILTKAFIDYQFGYCPIIWMFHNRKINAKINRLHERALKIVYKDHSLTYDELLVKDNSFTRHEKKLQKLAIEMYKINNNLSPTFMKSIFPESKNPYNLRTNNPFQTYNVHSVYKGTETISLRGPKTWAIVPDEIKNCSSLTEFKQKINQWKLVGCTCRICRTYVHELGFI